MSSFVEECRREWKRLGVPDLMADEMATDLDADLAEAQAEGVSAAEVLGESDPRRFAETWASERGLVSEPRPQKKSRKRLWIVLAIVVAVLAFFLGIGAVALLATPTVHTASAPPVRVRPISPSQSVTVPSLVGLKACHAERIAVARGLFLRDVRRHHCDAVVVGQSPAAGQVVGLHARLKLRLRS